MPRCFNDCSGIAPGQDPLHVATPRPRDNARPPCETFAVITITDKKAKSILRDTVSAPLRQYVNLDDTGGSRDDTLLALAPERSDRVAVEPQ